MKKDVDAVRLSIFCVVKMLSVHIGNHCEGLCDNV